MCLRRIALLLLLAGVAPAAAWAEEVRIIGDSIGEGLHLASSMPSPANRFNVAIYTPKIFEQIRDMPRGANVVMSLGTNDAVAGLDEQQPRILQIVAAAREQGIKLTWLGPPCVRTAWEAHSEKLDKVIAATLADTSVAYVSAQDARVLRARRCTPATASTLLWRAIGCYGRRRRPLRGSRSSKPPRATTSRSPRAARRRSGAKEARKKKKHVAPSATPAALRAGLSQTQAKGA